MKKPLEQVAKELAKSHREEDPDTVYVYLSKDPDGQEIRLVEVSGSVGYTGEVLPYRFKAQEAAGVPYPSTLILLNLKEWDEVQEGSLELPEGWQAPDDLFEIKLEGE